jgi:Ca-activated chloride channel homolog
MTMSSMTFIWPFVLWLLLIVPALSVAYIVAQGRRKRYAVRYPSLATVKNAIGRGPQVRRHVPAFLCLAGITIMLFALARPVAQRESWVDRIHSHYDDRRVGEHGSR